MMRAIKVLVLMAAAGSMGCSSVYTNIDKQPDGSYLVTRTKAGFLSAYGTLFRCAETASGMSCKEVAAP